MWKPSINFLALHYAWIITLSVLSLVIIYPHGNLKAVDAYFFGASASTESGLNTVDVKSLKTYQQVYLYLIPILGNLGFINIIVIVFRVRWFEKRFKAIAPNLLRPEAPPEQDAEAQLKHKKSLNNHDDEAQNDQFSSHEIDDSEKEKACVETWDKFSRVSLELNDAKADDTAVSNINPTKQTITFAEDNRPSSDKDKALYIPPPWKRERGASFSEIDERLYDEDDGRTEKVLSRRPTTRSIQSQRTLGIYTTNGNIDEYNGRSYIINHIQNQLTFDLWYIFLGSFCICVAEAGKIADTSILAFSVFSVLFEVVSVYGNVGLSLGYPTVSTSLSGKFTVFSKLVICVMMIRGCHRGLPYKLDRAIVLLGERLEEDHLDRDKA
ncbi:hypothetical protein DTO002I6_5358 [Penicillium roqueforti]|nr:hypothetical protein DTO002I6_5358 [Penicillium roqueforti]